MTLSQFLNENYRIIILCICIAAVAWYVFYLLFEFTNPDEIKENLWYKSERNQLCTLLAILSVMVFLLIITIYITGGGVTKDAPINLDVINNSNIIETQTKINEFTTAEVLVDNINEDLSIDISFKDNPDIKGILYVDNDFVSHINIRNILAVKGHIYYNIVDDEPLIIIGDKEIDRPKKVRAAILNNKVKEWHYESNI